MMKYAATVTTILALLSGVAMASSEKKFVRVRGKGALVFTKIVDKPADQTSISRYCFKKTLRGQDVVPVLPISDNDKWYQLDATNLWDNFEVGAKVHFNSSAGPINMQFNKHHPKGLEISEIDGDMVKLKGNGMTHQVPKSQLTLLEPLNYYVRTRDVADEEAWQLNIWNRERQARKEQKIKEDRKRRQTMITLKQEVLKSLKHEKTALTWENFRTKANQLTQKNHKQYPVYPNADAFQRKVLLPYMLKVWKRKDKDNQLPTPRPSGEITYTFAFRHNTIQVINQLAEHQIRKHNMKGKISWKPFKVGKRSKGDTSTLFLSRRDFVDAAKEADGFDLSHFLESRRSRRRL